MTKTNTPKSKALALLPEGTVCKKVEGKGVASFAVSLPSGTVVAQAANANQAWIAAADWAREQANKVVEGSNNPVEQIKKRFEEAEGEPFPGDSPDSKQLISRNTNFRVEGTVTGRAISDFHRHNSKLSALTSHIQMLGRELEGEPVGTKRSKRLEQKILDIADRIDDAIKEWK